MSSPQWPANSHEHSALKEAELVQAAISARGFDWPDVHGVLNKVREEVEEIQAAITANDFPHASRELGDLLLVAVNLARFLKADPEQVLRDALTRFRNRCQSLEAALADRGKEMESCTLEELDAVWDQVKVVADQGLNKGA